MTIKIITDHPNADFVQELTALFDKYYIKNANGWDDGNLYIYLKSGEECYVSFYDGETQ